ncbi:MAG: transcriptional repressor LexA [Candidatus Poribacteria bacterium]|nr:transcriptional repressor LexA [Candidatus Poribacteria bacterium]
MRKPMTKKQERIFEFIRSYLQNAGYPPTVREIGSAFEISEKGAHDHLNAIEKKGYIRRAPRKPRAIEIMEFVPKNIPQTVVQVPIVGRVAAGEPLLASQNIEGILPLPQEIVKDDTCFALRIKGESMVDAGILEGDFVIVKSQTYADVGDIVVALIGEEATVKRFFRDGAKIRLQPENAFMRPIITDDVQILGKVIALFRKM